MLTKSIVAILLAVCGVHSNTQAEQPDRQPPDPPDETAEGQHFCCESLDDGASGDGCVMIGKEHTSLCDKVLYCGVSWKKDGGKVTCIQ